MLDYHGADQRKYICGHPEATRKKWIGLQKQISARLVAPPCEGSSLRGWVSFMLLRTKNLSTELLQAPWAGGSSQLALQSRAGLLHRALLWTSALGCNCCRLTEQPAHSPGAAGYSE